MVDYTYRQCLVVYFPNNLLFDGTAKQNNESKRNGGEVQWLEETWV